MCECCSAFHRAPLPLNPSIGAQQKRIQDLDRWLCSTSHVCYVAKTRTDKLTNSASLNRIVISSHSDIKWDRVDSRTTLLRTNSEIGRTVWQKHQFFYIHHVSIYIVSLSIVCPSTLYLCLSCEKLSTNKLCQHRRFFFEITRYNSDTYNARALTPLWTHVRKPYPYEHLQRSSRQILEIDEVTTCASLSTGTSPTTECTMPLNPRIFAHLLFDIPFI